MPTPSDIEVEPIASSEPVECTPDSTRRRDVSGVSVVLGDGQEWTIAFAGLSPSFDEARDYFFGVATAFGQYDFGDDLNWAQAAVHRLLRIAHDLPESVAFELVRDADPVAILRGAEAALLGRREDGWDYSTWARASLRGNGIDPDTIPPLEIGPTLDVLEQQGKTLPKRLIPSVRMAEKRGQRGVRAGG